MRIIGLLISTLCLALLVSCTNRCTIHSKKFSFQSDSVLIYDRISSEEFKSLKIQNENSATYIFNGDLVQLNLKNYKKTKLFDGNLLKSIDFVDVLKKGNNAENYSTLEFSKEISGNSNQLNSLFEVKNLVNYWLDKDTIFLFVKASSPTISSGKIVAGTTKFLLRLVDSKLISIKPLICEFATFSIEDDAVFRKDGLFYFSTLPIVFRDSIHSYTTNRPSLLLTYQTESGVFKNINLRMSKSDLDSYIKYIEKSDQNYCTFINIAHCFQFNNALCFTDSKNLYFSSNLDSPLFKNIQIIPNEDVITALPNNNVNVESVLMFYKGNRREVDSKVTMTLNALNTCTGEILQSEIIQYHNKCSNVAIYGNNALYIVNHNDSLYLMHWRL